MRLVPLGELTEGLVSPFPFESGGDGGGSSGGPLAALSIPWVQPWVRSQGKSGCRPRGALPKGAVRDGPPRPGTLRVLGVAAKGPGREPDSEEIWVSICLRAIFRDLDLPETKLAPTSLRVRRGRDASRRLRW